MTTLIPKVKCEECGHEATHLGAHLKAKHGWSITKYQSEYPGAEVVHPALAKEIIDQRKIRTSHKKKAPLKELLKTTTIPNTAYRVVVVGTPRPTDPFWETPEEIEELVWVWNERKHAYIFGETGIGKSFNLRQIASMAGENLHIGGGHGDNLVNDLYGYMRITNGDTQFTEGLLPLSMEAGEPLLIEEIDRMPARLQVALHCAMDDRQLFIPEAGKSYYAKEGWRVIGTGNTQGRGDTEGRYAAAENVDMAFMRRLSIKIEMKMLSEFRQERLVKNKFPIYQGKPKILSDVLDVVKQIRMGIEKGEIYGEFGLATMLTLMEALTVFTVEKALELTFTSLLDRDEASAVKNIAMAKLGAGKILG